MADATYTAVVLATGKATVTIKPAGRSTWRVSQVSNEMSTAPGAATCALRKNGYLVSPLVPQADTAAGDPPVILLPNTDQLTIEWTNCTTGDIGRAMVVYEEIQ